MYNLRLSPEQLEIRDTVRDFVAQEVKPPALDPARLEAQMRPLLTGALDKAAQLGLRTLALSEEAGGAGADTLTCCIVTEELAVGDPDVAAVLAETSVLAHALFDRLTPQQRERFLPAFSPTTAITSHMRNRSLAAMRRSGSTIIGRRRATPATKPARNAPPQAG
jgi:alkylation response protein AidB-like acyl-CoA dehydrogenase